MNKRILAGGGAALLAIIGLLIWWVFLKDDVPEAVSIEGASEQLDEDLVAAAGEPVADSSVGETTIAGDPAATDDSPADDEVALDEAELPALDGDVSGTWIIDDEIGEFDFQTASGSFAGFRVDEELTVGETTAVGRSGDVIGSLTIENDVLIAAEVTVDMTTIASNDSRRERAIREAVGASQFPTATFVLTEPSALPDGLSTGEQVTVEAVGDLTVKGTSHQVTFEITALVRDDGFGVVIGSTQITWADFEVTPPTARIVVSVADQGVVEFQLVVAKE